MRSRRKAKNSGCVGGPCKRAIRRDHKERKKKGKYDIKNRRARFLTERRKGEGGKEKGKGLHNDGRTGISRLTRRRLSARKEAAKKGRTRAQQREGKKKRFTLPGGEVRKMGDLPGR